MTLRYIFIFIIFNLNNRMDLFKINGLTWWDKVNRPKKISQALVVIQLNPETLLPWPRCVRDYKNANMFFGPQLLKTKIQGVQGRECLKLMGQTSRWALNNNGPFLIRDIKWAMSNGFLVNFWVDFLGFGSAYQDLY